MAEIQKKNNTPEQSGFPGRRQLGQGCRIGEYSIVKKLSENVEGFVYLAQDSILGDMVQIKEFFPEEMAVRGNLPEDGEELSGSDALQPLEGCAAKFKYFRACFQDLYSTLRQERDNECLLPILQIVEQNATVYVVSEYRALQTLEQHLRSQISVQQLDERVRAAANYLAGCLDENGYLLAQAQDLAEAGFCESEFDEALAVIRNLEPLGVGASSLKECLCLQLDEGDEIARRLLDEIDLTGSIDPAELAARFGVPAQEIEQAMLRIRRLNPKPGSQYTSHSRSPYILPDVTMIKFVDEYYVALNDYSLPRIRINEEYQNMLLRARGEEHREEREYLEEKIADAKLLQEQIAFRGRTLLEVTKALIKLQEPFFRYGPRYTKLLPIQELAQALSMPEELVSATLKNKYLQSPFGVYPMKYFLAREHHPQQEGMEAIRQQLAQLIRGEHPDEPYTDEQLAQLMAKDGVFMTEELVERLREELNIPDSEHRIFYDPQSEEEHCCDDDCGHHHH